MATLGNLRALHVTIGSVLDDIENAYTSKGLDFPSPDVPLYRNDNIAAGFSVDDPAEKLMTEPTVARAASYAVAASSQIINTLQHPLFNLLESGTAVSTLHTLESCLFLTET